MIINGLVTNLMNFFMSKIIILNFETGEVLITDYDNNKWDDVEQFINSIMMNDTNCQWMIVDELNIKIK